MERLFSPCTRLHDFLDSQGQLEAIEHPELLQELNLDISTEELLSAERAFTYADLYAMLGNADTFAWLTPHAAVCGGGRGIRSWGPVAESYYFCFCFIADGIQLVALARSLEHLLEICDVVLRLLAASVVRSVIVRDVCNPIDVLINAPTLAYLMEQCQSLKVLKLELLALDGNHCRALGAYSRPDLEIDLEHCRITGVAAEALVEVLGRNQGPTKLDYCDIDNSVLTDGLRGNSRLKSLTPRISRDRGVGNQEVLAIAGALRENKGLADLNLSKDYTMSDESWGAICDSLKTHSTLEVLDLRVRVSVTAALLKSRIQALVNMLKVNMSIHTIHLNSRYGQHEIYRESVIPYLETNRLRPRLLAIQKTHPITFRTKVLGRALQAVRTDPNRFWMLLSGNAEVAFPPKIATIAAAANLPTLATTAATSITTNDAGVAASVMSAFPTTVTGSLPIAAAAGATSATTPCTASAGEKRKARP
jgi:hypothetical protein